MIEVKIGEDFSKAAGNDYRLLVIEADVSNGPTPEALTKEIESLADSMREVMEIADINRRPAIAATRAAYKRFGKDPNRYRPSQEQLSRRIMKGQGLYVVNALADVGNLVSIKSGCAVGVFDADKILGGLELGIGQAGEPYEGIGRGELNIEGLPIVRDAQGGIGTPTSDNVRTAVSDTTNRVVITVHCFAQEMGVEEIAREFERLLCDYCGCSGVEYQVLAC